MAKTQKQNERFARQALLEQQKILKPGECCKYLTALIDPTCLTVDLFGTGVESSLLAASFQVQIHPQKIPQIITWRRTNPQKLTTSGNLTSRFTVEPHLLLIFSGAELVDLVKSEQLDRRIQLALHEFPAKTHAHLLICGLKGHCSAHRGCVSRTRTELALTEIQLVHGVSHRLIESADELETVISQFAKAIAEEPFKRQKMDKLEKENFYLGNDSKDCVKVQNENGLSRLWQQQLTKLPLVTLEVAEAITAKYPMPAQLVEALEMATEPERLLEDLSIRRAGNSGRKVSTLLLSLDPNAVV